MTEALSPELKASLEKLVADNKIVVFMKGTKDFPVCGFSAQVAKVMELLDVEYKDINVLDDDEVRQGIKEFSNWPTIPQVYVNGDFIGGCDIVVEMFKSGELSKVVEKAAA